MIRPLKRPSAAGCWGPRRLGSPDYAKNSAKSTWTGRPIVYTSGGQRLSDSRLHEEVISREKLYGCAAVAREILQGEHAVGRVIARPFAGQPGAFRRTDGARRFQPAAAAPDGAGPGRRKGRARPRGGEINDIFAGRGHSDGGASPTGQHGRPSTETLEAMRSLEGPTADLRQLRRLRQRLATATTQPGTPGRWRRLTPGCPSSWPRCRKGRPVHPTADHGCDPTTPSTDHSRERVPLLVAGFGIRPAARPGHAATSPTWRHRRRPVRLPGPGSRGKLLSGDPGEGLTVRAAGPHRQEAGRRRADRDEIRCLVHVVHPGRSPTTRWPPSSWPCTSAA